MRRKERPKEQDFEEMNENKDLEKIRKDKFKNKEIKSILKEIILCLIFSTITLTLAYQMIDSNTFQYQYHLRNLFNVGDKSSNLFDARDLNDIWSQIIELFLPNLFAFKWYNGEIVKENNNLIYDFSSYLFGFAIIKQKRIKKEFCSDKVTFLQSGISILDKYYSNKETMKLLYPSNESCFTDYSFLNEDTNNYGLYWSKNTSFNQTSNLMKSFKFTKSKQLKDNIYFGKFNTYLGGGYVYNLTGESIKNDLLLLQKMNWIDKETRALFIEFTLFNPNIALLSQCDILFEILSTGTIIPTAKFITINLWTTSRQVPITALFITYLIIILILTTKEIKQLKQLKLKYFFQFWIYLNWSLFICSWTCLPMFLYKLYAINDLLNEIKKNSIKSFVNLSTLSSWNETLGILLAFCSFITTIKLLNLLRFNKKMNNLIKTIKNCSKELISFLIVFVILWLSFVQMMHLFYYDKTIEYSTIVKAMETNFLCILGRFDLKPLIQTNFTISSLIFVAYNTVIVIIMINILITIVSNTFSRTKKELKKKTKEESTFTYLKNKILLRLSNKSNQDINPTKFIDSTKLLELRAIELVNHLRNDIQNQLVI